MKTITIIHNLRTFLLILIAGLFTVGTIEIAFPQTTNAQSTQCDLEFLSNNDIVFYNPCASMCSTSTINNSVTSLNGTNNKEKIFNYWIAKGLTPEQAAGIAGNIQIESGFSPFRQEMSKSWPDGGWGIAQFTFGQRTMATDYTRNEIGAELFNKYYVNNYGGGVNEANGYVPDGVPVEINDQFLLAELNYLNQYTSSFAPSTIALRVNTLNAHYGQSIGTGVKLLDYIKTLTSAKEVAIAWTYLYEWPGDIKSTAASRGTIAESILAEMGSGTSSTDSCESVGSGGLSYEQAVKLMNYYLIHRKDNGDLGSYNTPGLVYQCTAFSYWFTTKFAGGSGHGNGGEVAENLLGQLPSAYQKLTPETMKPYTVYSIKGVADGYGHTGVIVGVNSTGGIVIAESNLRETAYPETVTGKLKSEFIYDAVNNWTEGRRGLYVTEWESVEAWQNFWDGTNYIYATPTDASSTASKVQAYMETIQ